MNSIFLLVIWLSLIITATSAAERAGQNEAGWTRFRGPDGSGISRATTIPASWADKDYYWRVVLPGKGHASPVIWGDKLFVTSGDENTGKRMALCLKTADGRLLWRRYYESKPFSKNRENSYATSTPVVDHDHVYVYWTTPDEVTLLALDHHGKEAWRRNLGPFMGRHGSGASPVVYEDLVVLSNDQEGRSQPSFLIAVEAKTGKTRWQIKRRTDRVSYSTPCVFRPENGPAELIFTSCGQGISSIDPLTGKQNWELAGAFPFRVVGSPVAASELIVASCGEAGVGRRLVAVRPGSGKQAPQLAYEMKASIPYVPTPLIANDLLFLWGDNGLVSCHRVATGERVWQEKIRDRFYSSPVWVNGRLYCISKSGVVYVLAVADKPQLLASIPLGEPSFATPAIANGTLYLRTESHLFAVGKILASLAAGSQ
jgi:outer membrane protein assembly factor BamB